MQKTPNAAAIFSDFGEKLIRSSSPLPRHPDVRDPSRVSRKKTTFQGRRDLARGKQTEMPMDVDGAGPCQCPGSTPAQHRGSN